MISYAPLFRTMANRGITSYRLMKLGFPRSTYYYAMKRGENISTRTVNQLCKILQCGVSDIMEYIDDDSPIRNDMPINSRLAAKLLNEN